MPPSHISAGSLWFFTRPIATQPIHTRPQSTWTVAMSSSHALVSVTQADTKPLFAQFHPTRKIKFSVFNEMHTVALKSCTGFPHPRTVRDQKWLYLVPECDELVKNLKNTSSLSQDITLVHLKAIYPGGAAKTNKNKCKNKQNINYKKTGRWHRWGKRTELVKYCSP